MDDARPEAATPNDVAELGQVYATGAGGGVGVDGVLVGGVPPPPPPHAVTSNEIVATRAVG
ncbi:MAG: hypothetical protein JO322_01440 [Candidatus Eremiobacteraeota bacterium]|nr:hypothetical protein [Candidatus Eremiobacteraeota bacterium]